jgi:serine/threonine-protein kinase RsbW
LAFGPQKPLAFRKYPTFRFPFQNTHHRLLAAGIALTFPGPTGKLSIRPYVAFGMARSPATLPQARRRLTQEPFAHMSADRVSYTLDSTLETVNNAEETASRMAADAGFDDEEIMKISMAVREAAVNAVLHGNAYDPNKKVTLAFERTPDDLVIVIRDQGKGLDASKIPDPLAPDNLMKTSGRGIFLIRSFMDVVEINPSQTGTELRMIKHVHGNPADSKEAPQ